MNSDTPHWANSQPAAPTDASVPPKPVLFLHIPKTAGTSFLTVLRNVFGDSRVMRLEGPYEHLPDRIRSAMRPDGADFACLVGHVPLHMMAPYLARLRPFTMLREPVARVLSLYRFLRAASPAAFAEIGLAPGFTFDDFINCRAPGTFAQVSNGMCRMLSGMASMADGNAADFRQPAAVVRARNAASRFLQRADFGIVEDMPATLALVRERWGISYPIEVSHENPTGPAGAEETPENISRIVALNTEDIALYHIARAQFRARIARQTADIPETADTIWHPQIGHCTGIADIPNRHSFHDYEPGGNFAWAMSATTPGVYFHPPHIAGHRSVRLALRLYLIHSNYDAAEIVLRLNGRQVTTSVVDVDGNWCTLLTAPQADWHGGLQHLTIAPPYTVPVRFLEPGSRDLRELGCALSSITIIV